MRKAAILLILMLCLAPSGCQAGAPAGAAPTPGRAWAYANLRALRAPAADADPALTPVALYTRQRRADVQIRIDLLDSRTPFDADLYIALDIHPGGSRALPIHTASDLEWDVLLVLPTQAPPRALAADLHPLPGLIPRVVRDPVLDTAVITLDRAALPRDGLRFAVEVFTTRPGEILPAGRLGPARSDGFPPGQAQLLLAFDQVLPAYTPAQGLRRWDGAHAGPLGQRHGLAELLEAAEDTGIPLALLDLKTPPALAALDYLGQTDRMRRMAAAGGLILPDAAYGDPALPEGLAFSRAAARAFGLPASPFYYGAAPEVPSGYPAAFACLPGVERVLEPDGIRLIPLAAGCAAPEVGTALPAEVDAAGLTLTARRRLLSAAVAGDTGRLVVLGGSLPASAWADRTVAGPAFAWLAGHPWIRPLRGADLLGLPACSTGACPLDYAKICPDRLCLPPAPATPLFTSAGAPSPAGLTAADALHAAADRLRTAPQGAITHLGWQMLLALSDPAGDEALARLRAGYYGQIGALIAAAEWEHSPAARADCSLDFDQDGAPDCILAAPDAFAALQSDGARLLFAFARDAQGVHQLVGPSAQLVVGLSDPSEWQPDLGPAGDPSAVAGAFSDEARTWEPYQARAEPGRVTFTSADGARHKVYTLLPGGLRVDYHGWDAIAADLPLAVDPAERFTPGWSALYMPGGTTLEPTWGVAAGPRVALRASAPLRADWFTDSTRLAGSPEDPDRSYPPGHYLPFPLGLAHLQAQAEAWVELRLH